MCCKNPFLVSMMGFLAGMAGFLALVRGIEFGYRNLVEEEGPVASQNESPPSLQPMSASVTDGPIVDSNMPLISEDIPSLAASREQFLLAFEQVWKTIDTKHWESNPNGLDWKLIRQEFEPRVAAATEAAQVDQILNEMLGRLKQSHFGVIPASQYEPIGSNDDHSGSVGIALRMVEASSL